MKKKSLAKAWQVFWLTWFSYAALYLTRKNFSVIKSDLHALEGLSVATLSLVDTSFLVVYAVGQFYSGFLSDKFGPKMVMVIGLLGSAIISFITGYQNHGIVIVALFAFNGLFQSTGWACNIKAIEPWFLHEQRGRIMAWWGTNQQVGGLLATAGAAFIAGLLGWRFAFFVPATVVFVIGIVLLLKLPKGPEHRCDHHMVKRGANYWSICTQPFWVCLSVSYFGLKLIRYCLLFWLPFYFHKHLGLPTDIAAYVSISFEVGGIVGSFSIGWISDKYFAKQRVRLILPLLLMTAGVFFCYQIVSPKALMINCFFMMIIGFLVFGPDSLISGACAQDIGKEHTGVAAGFINGMGSLGAIIQGSLVTYVSAHYGWSSLFFVFFLISLASCLVVAPFYNKSFVSEKYASETVSLQALEIAHRN